MAPEVTGLEFPDHAHQEYPKVLYIGGVERDSDGTISESITVHGVDEEAEARENGYGSPAAATQDEEAAAEGLEAPVAGSEEAFEASQENAPLAEAEPHVHEGLADHPLDHDHDGHKGGSLKGGNRRKK